MADERNNVETLEIKVVSNTKDATDGLAKLVGTLDKLKNVTKGNNGFDGLQKSLESITATASKLESGAILKLRYLAQGLKALGEVKISKTIEDRLFNIGAAVDLLKDIDMTKLTELTGGLQTFSSVGNIKMPVAGKASVPGTPAATASLPDISMTGKDVKAAAEKLEEGKSKFAEFAQVARSAFASVKPAAKSLFSAIGGFLSKHSAGIKKFGSSIGRFLTAPFRKAKEEVTKFTGAFGRFFAMFKKRAMYRMINGIISAITDGFKTGVSNLYQYSKAINGPFADSMDRIATALLYFKNSIGAAVGPLINMLAPAIEYVTDKAVEFLNTINQLFARLSGASTWTKAIRYPKEYAEAADDAKKANEELKRTILGFDELNVLQDNKTKDSSKSKTADDYSKMFEEVALTAADNPFAGFFEPFKAAWDNEGQNTINSIKKAFGQVKELISTVGQTFAEVWKNGTGQQTVESLLRIFQNLVSTVGNLAESLSDAWKEGDNGLRIVQGLWDIFNSILGTIERITKATSDWAAELDLTPLLTSVAGLIESLKPLVDLLGDSLGDMFEDVIKPVLTWIVEEAAPAAIELFASVADTVTKVLTPLKNGFDTIKESLSPVITWIEDTAIDIIKTLKEQVDKFGKAVEEHAPGIEQAFKDIGDAIAAIWGVAKPTLDTAEKETTSKLGIIGTFFADEVGAWTKLFGGFTGFLAGIFTGDWSRAWDGIKLIFFGFVDDIVATWKARIDLFVSAVHTFIGLVKNAFTAFVKWAGDFGESVYDWVTDLGRRFRIWIDDFLEKVTDFITRAIDGMFDFFLSVGENTIKVAKAAWGGFKDFWVGLWEGLKSAVKFAVNGILGFVESLVNGVINGLNRMITALNGLSFDVPEWVPLIGGGKFGFNLSTLQTITIPRLAEGGMVNAGTMFVAGEAGAEVVAQMGSRTGVMNTDEMRESVEQGLIGASNALGAAVASALIRANNQGVGSPVVEVTITADSETLYKAVRKGEQYYNNRYHVVAGV